jgi:hypothetical protein
MTATSGPVVSFLDEFGMILTIVVIHANFKRSMPAIYRRQS